METKQEEMQKNIGGDILAASLDGAVESSYVLDAISDNEQDVANNQKTIEYSAQTGKAVPDYFSEYKSTISGTGSDLDGQNVFDVANAKEATPKEIFNLWDTVVSALDGLRAAGVNLAQTGGELLTSALDNTISAIERSVGVDPEQSKRELKESTDKFFSYFGGPETMESKSYSGAIAGTAAQFVGGGSISKGVKGAKIAAQVAKTNAGKKLVAGFVTLLKDMTTMGTSFDKNQKNLSEFVENFFGISMPEMLTKQEDDQDLTKRFKNSIDAPIAKAVALGTMKIVKNVFAKRAAAVEKGVAAVEKAEDAAIKSGATGEEFAKVTEEALENRMKAFSNKEIGAIIEKAEKDGIVPAGSLKNANRKVLENAAVRISQLNRTASATGQEAQEALLKYTNGELNEKSAKEIAMKLWQDITEKTAKVKESLSSSGQIEQVASTSDALKYMNKATAYVVENADRLNFKQMLEIMSKVKDPNTAGAFFDALVGRVSKGKVSDILDKLAFIEQDMYLLSAGSRLKDAASTFGHLMLQTGETAVAGMVIHPLRVGAKKAISLVRNPRATIAGQKALTTFKDPQDMVYFGEALDMVHGAASMLMNGVYTAARKSLEKAGVLQKTGETAFQKAIRQSVDASQSRLYLRREVQTNVFSTNSKFGQMMNKILNRGGIWAAEKIDDFNQAIAYRAHLERNVGIMARKNQALNGWTDAETKAFAKKMLVDSEKVEINPNKVYDFMQATTIEGQLEAAVRRSAKEAGVTTFREPLVRGSWEDKFYRFINETDGLRQTVRVLFPFQKTSLKIGAEEFLRKRSGWASIPYVRSQISQGGRAAEEAFARIATGAGIQGTAIYLMMEGKLTGPRPQNAGEAALWDSEGRQEYSYKTDGGWISYKDIAGPIGSLLVEITTIFDRIRRINEAIDESSEDEWSDYLLQMPSILAEAALSETVIGNWLEAVEQGDTAYFQHAGRSLATMAPKIISELRYWDENKKITTDILDEFQRKWGIDTAEDDLNLFGLPIYAKHHFYLGHKYSPEEENLVTDTMLYYKAFVEPPRNSATYDNVRVDLSKAEVLQWKKIMAEKDAFGKMLSLIMSKDFKEAGETKRDFSGNLQVNRKGLLTKEYNDVKNEAFEELLKRNIDVYRKYNKSKERQINIPTISEQYESKKPSL